MFEYSADLVMSLSIKGDKPEERNANMLLKKRPVIASITKNRYGSCGIVEFEFNAPAAMFTKSANYGARTLHWWIPGSQSMLVVR